VARPTEPVPGVYARHEPPKPGPAEQAFASVLKPLKKPVAYNEALDVVSRWKTGLPCDRGSRVVEPRVAPNGDLYDDRTSTWLGTQKHGLRPDEARSWLDDLARRGLVAFDGVPQYGYGCGGTVRAATQADRDRWAAEVRHEAERREQIRRDHQLVEVNLDGQRFHCSRAEAEALKAQHKAARRAELEAALAELKADATTTD
jgi:hypothetical protein